MIKCPSCGEENPPGVGLCKHCGGQIPMKEDVRPDVPPGSLEEQVLELCRREKDRCGQTLSRKNRRRPERSHGGRGSSGKTAQHHCVWSRVRRSFADRCRGRVFDAEIHRCCLESVLWRHVFLCGIDPIIAGHAFFYPPMIPRPVPGCTISNIDFMYLYISHTPCGRRRCRRCR